MRSVVWSTGFIRAFKRTVKKHPASRQDVEDALRLLAEDSFAPRLDPYQ